MAIFMRRYQQLIFSCKSNSIILPKLSLSGPGGFREGMRNPVTTLIKLRVQEL